MVNAIGILLNDPFTRTSLGAAARRRVEAIYNWDAIAAAQSRLYRDLTM